MRTYLICFLFNFLFLAAHAQVVLEDMRPSRGPRGTEVTLTGGGFPQGLGVIISGEPQAVTQVTATEVRFVIGPGADSGEVVIQHEGQSYTNFAPFIITRVVPGSLTLPLGENPQDYSIYIDGKESSVAANGSFAGEVPLDGFALVWAYRSEQQTALTKIVFPDESEIALTPRSTAEAMVLMTPPLFSKDVDLLRAAHNTFAQVPELEQFSTLVASAIQAGRDFIDDPRLEDVWSRAVSSAIEKRVIPAPGLAAHAFEPGTPAGTKVRYLNPPAGYHGYPDLRRLKTTILPPNANHPDEYRFEIKNAGRFSPVPNPVDWNVSLYELDPAQFTDGFLSISNLNHNQVLQKLSPQAVDSGVVYASLSAKYVDIPALAASEISKKVFGTINEETPALVPPDQLRAPSYLPGVYLVESYSGNIRWGTTAFWESPPSQSYQIDQTGGGVDYWLAFAANGTVMAIDTASTVVDFRSMLASSSGGNSKKAAYLSKLIQGVKKDLLKGLPLHASDPIDPDLAYDAVRIAATSALKNTLKYVVDNPGEFVNPKVLFGKASKVLGKTLNIFGKISTGAGVFERGAGLFGNGVLATERTIVVIGDPFSPKIEWFNPQQGRGGETLLIMGHNFPTDTNLLKVSFCSFMSTENPTEPSAQLFLPVLSATPTSIAVKVPTNAPAIFPTLRAFICVEVKDKPLRGTTIPLYTPYHQFRFIPPPEITSVEPNPVFPGGVMQVFGNNFVDKHPTLHRVLIDGSFATAAYLVSSNSLFVDLPPYISAGTHTLAIQVFDTRTEAISFSVVNPRTSDAGKPTKGLEITITKADFSNAADGEISVLEAYLIAEGKLGRAIEDHLPCEDIPPGEPGHCPRQRREMDHVRYYGEGGKIGGPDSIDRISVSSGIQGTVAHGSLPPITTSGDVYALSLIFDGGGAASDGLVLEGVSEVRIVNLKLQNYGGNGVVLRNASNNSLDTMRVDNLGAQGVLLEGNTMGNLLFGLSISNAVQHGVLLRGTGVMRNEFSAAGGGVDIFGGGIRPFTRIEKCGGNGIRLENGASFNYIYPGTVRENGAEGILVTGEQTDYNFIGRASDELYRLHDVVFNNGAGVRLTAGVEGTVIRYINAGGNKGDGILLEGLDCANNQIDRVFVGINRYELITDLALPNEGSGIHLKNGARDNLIGSRTVSFGEYGAVAGNRDDGILLEGDDTHGNIVNAQEIGIHSIEYNPRFKVNFVENGKAGIRIRDGSHNNIIGESDKSLANHIFASPEAGIVLEGVNTRSNLVFGNQIGAYHQQWSPGDSGFNRIGIWIRDKANDNQIGQPGAPVTVWRFPGVPESEHVFWNVIARATEAGIQIDDAGGTVNTDQQLERPNRIQNNRIGEEDRGGISPNHTGIKLGQGALANLIGGDLPIHGNRILANRRAGIWIANNDCPSPLMANRIQRNHIAESGVNGALRYPTYMSETPSGGVGILVTDSSGHWIGSANEKLKNTLNWNRFGIYLANSSSNRIQNNLIDNHFMAALVIRGGERNVVGGRDIYGNKIVGFGLADPGHGGVVLSETRFNVVSGNLIGTLAPGRGGSGIILTNAPGNRIGGSSQVLTVNEIIGNMFHGIFIIGPNSTENGIYENQIGTFLAPNGGDGVRLEGGAHGNRIGGTLVVNGSPLDLGNTIQFNNGSGVAVDGPATLANSILFNRITGNVGKGISHTNGGNDLIPAPVYEMFDGVVLGGRVSDLAKVPPGSRVQIFGDSNPFEPEGVDPLGEAYVAPNGTWSTVLSSPLNPSNPTISLTATHPITGSTSEFGTGTTNLIGFAVSRTDNSLTELAPAGMPSVPVFRLSLQAINADVRVKSIAFDAGGTLPEPAAISGARLYQDMDLNGRVGMEDFQLGNLQTFTADDGRITFTVTNKLLEANTIQHWLLAFDLTTNAPAGSAFHLVLTNQQAVDAEFIFPPVEARALGTFAIRSADFTVGSAPAGQTFTAWLSSAFTPEELQDQNISGPGADPDGDQVVNLLEYAFNLNPKSADRDVSTDSRKGIPRASRVLVVNPQTQQEEEILEVMFVRRKEPVDLVYEIFLSEDLQDWMSLANDPQVATSEAESIGDEITIERTRVRATKPIRGLNALDTQFVKVSVRKKE